MLPCPSPIVRTIDAVTHGQVRALQPFARADIDDAGIGGRDRDGTDRTRRLVVEDRLPGSPGVGRPPHTTMIDADQELMPLTGNANGRHRTAAAERADTAPTQVLRHAFVHGRRADTLRRCQGRGARDDDDQHRDDPRGPDPPRGNDV